MRKLLPIALNWGVTTIRMTGNDKPEIMQVYEDAKAASFRRRACTAPGRDSTSRVRIRARRR